MVSIWVRVKDKTPRFASAVETTRVPSFSSSSSRMRVIYHNWSATKQRPHPQSVAEISHHSVLSGDRIRQCDTSVIANREMNTLLEYGPHLHLPFYFPQR